MGTLSLEERRAQAETEFNALETEKQKLNIRFDEITQRQYELRGQYQILNDISTEQAARVTPAPVSPEADVIDVPSALDTKVDKGPAK